MRRMTYPCDISCVIPVKDGGLLLVDCLESLLHQDFSGSFEICVYDDGSTDSTPCNLDEYKSKFEFKSIGFKVKSSEFPRGVGYAKNGAASLSSARFLCFCDADDVSDANRLSVLFSSAMSLPDPDSAFLGSSARREPKNSTVRFIDWANQMTDENILAQMYTSHGPPLIAPTWFVARRLFESVGGFHCEPRGYPEDLEFFYRAIDHNPTLRKVSECLVTYTYHAGCATFSVLESTIWDIRLKELEKRILSRWTTFTIWSVGKQGKRFYRSLSMNSRAKVIAFCDVDVRKLKRREYEDWNEKTRIVTRRIPILAIADIVPPFIVCVKQNMTGGDLEELLQPFREGTDYIHFG